MARLLAVIAVSLVSSACSACVKDSVSCNPTANDCCQGPRLMTCRLRPISKEEGSHGEAYTCGAEFPEQLLEEPSCTGEGELCSPGVESCCQHSAKKLSCQVDSEKTALEKKAYTCMAAAEPAQEETSTCISEGDSCSPGENRCCQGGALRNLRTCRLKAFNVYNAHGMAFECAKEP